jgi:hypothetical protein
MRETSSFALLSIALASSANTGVSKICCNGTRTWGVVNTAGKPRYHQ